MNNYPNINPYRKIQHESYIIKNQKIKNKNDPNNVFSIRNKLINAAMSNYSGKSYSSIKSLIKRIQSVSNTKITHKLKIFNQRPDIFLQGGSINNYVKTNKQKQQKQMVKTTYLNHNKYSSKISNYLPDPQQQSQIEANLVFISQKKVNYNNQNTKTLRMNQTAKNFKTQYNYKKPYNSMHKNGQKQRYYEIPIQSSIQINQENIPKINSLVAKNQSLINFIQVQLKHAQTQQTNSSMHNFNKHKIPISINRSENQIKKYNKNNKIIKLIKPISNVNNDTQIQLTKKQTKIQQIFKPLFYLNQQDIKDMKITCKNFVVCEYPSGQIVTGSYVKQVAQIASLTKIVTFYCCLLIIQSQNLNMDSEYLVIDQQIQSTSGTSAYLLQGDKYTFRQICYGLMLPSGNDAALALAKWGGSKIRKNQTQSDLKVFMKYMNQVCFSIGMKSTFFGNPHGLPHTKSGTTVQDLAILINKALNIDFFRQVIKTKVFKCEVQNTGIKRQVEWQNTNKLLRRKGFIGIKTGVTVTAGPCLATCYQIGNKIYIIILLKTTKLSKRFKQTRIILGKVLSKLNFNLYRNQIRQILRNDVDLDSDNSQDQQQFNYQRSDGQQMNRRLKIITYEM